MRATLLLLTALAVFAPAARAVNCKAACAVQIRKCVKKCCNPPIFDVPRKACVLGLRGAAIFACNQSGKQACPKKVCIIDDCANPG